MITSTNHPVPSSPPPSFHSRSPSPTSRRLLSHDPLGDSHNNDLDDAFDDGNPSDDENDGDDRQRLMRADSRQPSTTQNSANENASQTQPRIERRVTQLPTFAPQAANAIPRTIPSTTNDGVFANLTAKPERGEPVDEKPPVRYISLDHDKILY